MDDSIKKIIEETVESTISKMRAAELLKDTEKTAYQKTEELLRIYRVLLLMPEDKREKIEETESKVNKALKRIEEDIYFEIIPMTYFKNRSREEIAEYYQTSVTTISRNKKRLIEKMKVYLFPEKAIKEIGV